MGVLLKFWCDCPHCGRKCSNTVYDLSIPAPDAGSDPFRESARIEIEVDLQLSQANFECEGCGCVFSTGDFGDFLFDPGEGQCGGRVDDDDDGGGEWASADSNPDVSPVDREELDRRRT